MNGTHRLPSDYIGRLIPVMTPFLPATQQSHMHPYPIYSLEGPSQQLNRVSPSSEPSPEPACPSPDPSLQPILPVPCCESTVSIKNRNVCHDIDDQIWLQRFNELRAYQREHGHTDVPRLFANNLALASWVHSQRKDHKRFVSGQKTTITHAKVTELQSMGFKWDLHGAMWNQRLDELKVFRVKHGHCDIPQRFADNPSLGRWVNTQRLQQRLRSDGKKSDMTEERYQKLSNLGFVW